MGFPAARLLIGPVQCARLAPRAAYVNLAPPVPTLTMVARENEMIALPFLRAMNDLEGEPTLPSNPFSFRV
jgi:hypothetical protein